MTKQALPKADIDSILIYIGFVLLIILAVLLMIGKFKETISSRAEDITMYSQPTLHKETILSTEVSQTSEESLLNLDN